jgi:hypothetical protein
MADDDVIVVSLEPDADTEQTEQPRDEAGKFVRIEGSDPVKDIEAQFAELTEQSKADRQRAQDAERRAAAAAQDAARARQEATVAKTEIADSQYETIVSGMTEAQTALKAAKAQYRQAFEAGDVDAVSNAVESMTEAKARLLRLDESKADLEARRTTRSESTQREQRTETVQRQIADPLEDLIANSSAQTGAWFRAHPEEGRAFALSCRNQGSQADNRRRAKLDAAHMDAISEGISPDTPEYFTHVESFLGIGKQQQTRQTNGDARQTTTTTRRRAAVPVAPVHQSAGGTTGGGPEVRLSPVEAKAAQDGTHVWASHDLAAGRIKDKSQIGQPIGIQEFARRKHHMTKEGHYSRIYLEQ